MKKVLLTIALFITYNTYAQKSEYQKDSVDIVRYKTIFNPSEKAAKQAAYLGFELMNAEISSYFPLQLFNLKGVKKMAVTSNENELFKDFALEFDSKGQLTKVAGKRDSLQVIYKDNAPSKFISSRGKSLEFHYSRDTVVLIDKEVMGLYVLNGSFLLNIKTYSLSGTDLTKRNTVLNSARVVKLKGDSVQLISNDNNEPRYSTNSKNWMLPFIREYKMGYHDHSYKVKDIYYNDRQGNLVLNKTLNGEDRVQLIFKMKNGRPVSISHTWQFLSENGKSDPSPEIVNISYH